MKKYYFFDDLVLMLSKNAKTELEEAILTSIHWIGEAQNDFNHTDAFVKYWIAIETFFSISNEDITDSLAKGISTLLTAGGYRFVKINEATKIYKRTKNLYIKRNKIIHRGIYEDISPTELSEICKYAVWCVLTCLGFRSSGCKTLKQIKNEVNRNYKVLLRIIK